MGREQRTTPDTSGSTPGRHRDGGDVGCHEGRGPRPWPLRTKPEPVTAPAPAFVIAAPDKPSLSDQLMRDIAEIERARDALDALPLAASFSARRRTQALTLVPVAHVGHGAGGRRWRARAGDAHGVRRCRRDDQARALARDPTPPSAIPRRARSTREPLRRRGSEREPSRI